MKIKWKQLLICLLIPLAVGGVSGFICRDAFRNFESVQQPPLSPPGWLFPIVWGILYLLMGISSYLILNTEATQRMQQSALTVYGFQLFLNFFWSPLFFLLKAYLFAFFWLVALWIATLVMLIRFYKIKPLAAYLNIPYLLWLTFAGYLNFAIFLLN